MKKIIHVDMDAYYAAVEIRENPSLKGKPLIVGGHPQSRGVVSTCSYEARKYGIHSGMSSYLAWQLCPGAIFVYPNFRLYKVISEQIREIFFKYTEKVETMSLDEAYLDLSEADSGEDLPVSIARRIKDEIMQRTSLTCSAGVSFNKFLAKIGSELKKPDGLVVITKENARDILFDLPIEKFHGIGKVTAARMKNLGISTGKELYAQELKDLIRSFGKAGVFYYYVVRGIDDREVVTYTEPKSISCESTFDEDISSFQELTEELGLLADKLSFRMQSKDILGQVFCLKIKYDNFETVTKSQSLDEMTNERDAIYKFSENLLIRHWDTNRKIRLLGIGFNRIETGGKSDQIELWDMDAKD